MVSRDAVSHIAYKNIFPRDFSNLQLNQGMVFTIFNKKNEFIKLELSDIKALETNLNEKIEAIENEKLESIEELDWVYSRKISVLSGKHGNRTHLPPYQDEYKSLLKEKEKRKEAIESILENKRPRFKEKLSEAKGSIARKDSEKLHKAISVKNIENIFKVTHVNEIGEETTFNEIKSSEYFDLLKYLIRNGYIDETYPDYMTYFYENSVNRIDKIFLRSVIDKMPKENTYKLQNIEQIVSRLKDADYESEETLNFDLFEFLLKHRYRYSKQLKILFDQIKREEYFNFVGGFFDTKREEEKFIEECNRQWPQIFSLIVKNKEFTSEQIKLYSLNTLYYSQNIEKININNCLRDYISSKSDYLDIVGSIDEDLAEILIQHLVTLDVKFASIDFDHTQKDLFNRIYQNNLYEINDKNISLMLEKQYSEKNIDGCFSHKNYSVIMSQPNSSLVKYINMHINDYLDIILEHCKELINDNEKNVLLILNNEDITVDRKEKYLEVLKTEIMGIKEVSDKSLWEHLIKRQLVNYNEENIIEYFDYSRELDEPLITFLNGKDFKIDFSSIEIGEGLRSELLREIVVCNELADEKYESMMSSLYQRFTNFDFEGISGEKLKILIKNKIIKMDSGSLIFVRKSYPVQKYSYIRQNLDDYIKLIDSELFNLVEATLILDWEIGDDYKRALLEFMTNPISINGKNYSTEIIDNILEKNFDIDDLLPLCSTFPKEASTQALVLKRMIENLSLLESQLDQVSNEALMSLFTSDDLVPEKKVDLLVLKIPELTKKKCKEYLNAAGLNEFSKIIERRTKRLIAENPINMKILEVLKEKKFIDDFFSSQEQPGYFMINDKSKDNINQ